MANVGECISIIFRMTPEQRTRTLQWCQKKLPAHEFMQVQQIFSMAERAWAMMNGGFA